MKRPMGYLLELQWPSMAVVFWSDHLTSHILGSDRGGVNRQ
jgi:hypothetical protein